MQEAILPLAIAMMAGPQIISSIIFVSTKTPVKVSVAYIAGVAVAVVLGVALAYWLFHSVLSSATFGNTGNTGLRPIQILLVGLLLFLAIKSYVQRDKMEQPKWLQTLNSMPPARAFRLGLLLILLFPTDILVILVIGATLAQANEHLKAALPFMVLTIFIASLPLLLFLLFRNRMVKIMPKVREWTETHGWLINIGVYVLFAVLILS